MIEPWNCTAKEYHAEFGWMGHSMLEDFRESVKLFYDSYVACTLLPRDPTPAMALGSAVHAMILQPDKVDRLIAVEPRVDGRTKEGKAIKEAFRAESNGQIVITAEQHVVAQDMAASALAHPLVKELTAEPGMCERAVRVECPEVGRLKAMFDKLFPAGHILDLKTSTSPNPESFGRQAANLGYHRQADHYERVRDLALGEGAGHFYYAVIGSDEPYDTVVYELDEAARGLGRAQNSVLLAELKHRRDNGDWSSRWAGVQRLELPYWAYKEIK